MAATSASRSINDLLDDSLVEIFCRLPCKFVFKCKCVSKRWFSLISDPKFHCVYLDRQRSFFLKLQDQGEELDQQVFILNPYNALVIVPRVPSLAFGSLERELSLSFLGPDMETVDEIPLLMSIMRFVFGCSNGLFLCGKPRSQYKCKFSICNPLTRDCLELPLAPTACDKAGVLVGFTCEPYYHVEADNVSVNSEYRFCVVRVPAFTDTRFTFNVEVLSSETGEWAEYGVSCPNGISFGSYLTALGVSHNGKLYFTGARKILVYDPCNNQEVASVIDFPGDFGESYRGCFGVSCGCLRIAEFPTPRLPLRDVRAHSGRVWELEECEIGEASSRWKLVHEFCLPDIMGQMFDKLGGFENGLLRGFSRILAFHPQDGATVFMNFGSQILSCNLLSESFKLTKYGGLPLGYYPVTPLLLPWWPTPVPSISLPLDHHSL